MRQIKKMITAMLLFTAGSSYSLAQDSEQGTPHSIDFKTYFEVYEKLVKAPEYDSRKLGYGSLKVLSRQAAEDFLLNFDDTATLTRGNEVVSKWSRRAKLLVVNPSAEAFQTTTKLRIFSHSGGAFLPLENPAVEKETFKVFRWSVSVPGLLNGEPANIEVPVVVNRWDFINRDGKSKRWFVMEQFLSLQEDWDRTDIQPAFEDTPEIRNEFALLIAQALPELANQYERYMKFSNAEHPDFSPAKNAETYLPLVGVALELLRDPVLTEKTQSDLKEAASNVNTKIKRIAVRSSSLRFDSKNTRSN